MEISEKEFEYLLGKSNVPFKAKKAVMVEITALLLYNNDMKKTYEGAAEWQALLAKKEDEIASLNRQVDFSKQPTEQVVHELPEEERICPECGGVLHQCGQSVARRELVYVPAQYKVVEYVQAVYSCRRCEWENDQVPMKKGVVPAPLIPGSGIVSPSLLAHILNSKYTLALPLYRQEQELVRLGVPISRQTMANWVVVAYERWFSDFLQVLRRELLSNDILRADETTLMVLRKPGRKAQQKSYVWVYRTSGNVRHPVVLYDYQPSRAGECASDFLKGFSGFLHTDGYEAYHDRRPSFISAAGLFCPCHVPLYLTLL